MCKKRYYDYGDILSRKDLNGEIPSIYIITSNRSAGKTFGALDLCLKEFKDKGRMFMLLYRTRDELSGADTIFRDVLNLHKEYGLEMTSKSTSNGLFYTLYLDGEECGYAVSIRQPDKVKKYSGTFAKVYNIIFDEFMLETGDYIKNEDERLYSVLMTVARGGGSVSRYVRVFLLGNNVSTVNPYFLRFGINDRIKPNTKFIRGDGWICHLATNEYASQEVAKNPISRAFGGNIVEYSTQQKFLLDDDSYIKRLSGNGDYVGTIVYDGESYGLYKQKSEFYITTKPNNSGKVFIFRSKDTTQKNPSLTAGVAILRILRQYWIEGKVWCENQKIKKIMINVLSIAY